MKVIILHLSDIHIKTSNDAIIKKAQAIAAAVFPALHNASHVFIVCSGDVAYSGTAAQYQGASKLFKEIESILKRESGCNVNFIIAPGNHDCDFGRNNIARQTLIATMENEESLEVDDSVIDICTNVQEEFFIFRDSLEDRSIVSGDKLWRSYRFELNGKVISFECLNISWVSKIHEDPGKLYFPLDRYANQPFDHVNARLIVLHHPLNWFSQGIYRPFRTFIRKHANIVITGHEHAGSVGIINDVETNKSAYIEGCVLQHNENDISGSSFNVAIIDLELGKFNNTRYEWDGNRYVENESGSWTDYHDLPVKRISPFELTTGFQEKIEDAGAYFKHPNKTTVELSDIYVFPDLRRVGNGDDRRRTFVSSRTLLEPVVIEEGVLIEGEEKSGCTSLLYQLYRHYQDRGIVPIYINGKDLKKNSDVEVDKSIRRSVEHQYGGGSVDAFFQLSRTQKLLLLDDFDDCPLRAGESRAELLRALRKRFGHLVVVVTDMFEIREMLEGEAARDLTDLVHYKLQPFGHALRGELISRWLSLGADGTLDEAGMIARLDQAEKFMNAVMQKTVIPALPLYLLTLLQSMDAGRSGDFKESAHGYYYQYLLTEAFQDSGIKPDKLTEHFQYSAHLAWEFHRQDKRELTESDLRFFNERFTNEWHTVDFRERLDVLLRARVLCRVGEDYCFRYPYIYYYLKGKFLSENLSDLSIREYIEHCCRHLYVRNHANTVLFLAHHSNDDFVLRAIATALKNLFKDRSPVKFSGDTIAIDKLIEDAPKLVYSGEKPVEHRVRRNALRDELDNGNDGLLEREEEAEQLSLIAQMTMLFKTTEILGQVLKNQYSKIQRNRKAELIEDLFSGPLRAIRYFYEFIEKNPDALVAEIEAALHRKGKAENAEERKALARKVTASLIQALSYVFLLRASQTANSEALQEDVRSVVRRVNTPAFRLIELGILLDSPKAIPRSLLSGLFKEIKDDLVASRIIHMMVLNRLYMFKTNEQDMQWLSQEIKIDLLTQHSIAYQEGKRRLTK